MLVATLFPVFEAVDFDLEGATESPKRLVITKEDARTWAESEICKGRDKPEWEFLDWQDGKTISWQVSPHEGEVEEWILVVEDVPFWKP